MKIEAIDVTLVDVPASRPIQMSFTTAQKQSYAIVQIRAGGLVGIGEGSSVGGPTWSSECAETIKVIIETYLAPLVIGKDAITLRELQHLMKRHASGNYSVKAAPDVALHATKAHSLNLSMSDLIGVANRPSTLRTSRHSF